MSWITNYLFESTLESQGFKVFVFISCFITRTPIFWPCIKITKNIITNGLRFAMLSSSNSKFDKNGSNTSDDWLGER